MTALVGIVGAWLASAGPLMVAAAKKTAKKAQEDFILDNALWRIIFNEEQGKSFFFNTKTGDSTWSDPRKAQTTSQETLTTFIIFMLPFLVMALAGGAYLLYIRVAHPDVLKTPKKGKGKFEHSLAKAAKTKKKAGAADSGASGGEEKVAEVKKDE